MHCVHSTSPSSKRSKPTKQRQRKPERQLVFGVPGSGLPLPVHHGENMSTNAAQPSLPSTRPSMMCATLHPLSSPHHFIILTRIAATIPQVPKFSDFCHSKNVLQSTNGDDLQSLLKGPINHIIKYRDFIEVDQNSSFIKY